MRLFFTLTWLCVFIKCHCYCADVQFIKTYIQHTGFKRCWSKLKSVISPNNSPLNPPLENDGQIYTDNLDKAAEINVVIKPLPVGKAIGPDGINNKINRELSVELSLSFFSIQPVSTSRCVFRLLENTN